MSISPQSHHAEADMSSFPNNCNVSLLRKSCAHAATCTVRRFWCRQLLRSCGILDGPACSIHCMAHRFLYRRLRRSCANSDVSWLNSPRALICGTWFFIESVCLSLCWASGCCQRATKTAKALPRYVMNACICSCMSSSIVWRIYVGFVANIDIKILGIMRR